MGALLKDDTILIICCEDGIVYKYSLKNPTSPYHHKTIKLSETVLSILKLSEEICLFG